MAIKSEMRNAERGMRNSFGKIGVLMGGPSSEREISLKSGGAVYAALKSLGMDVIAVDILNDDIKQVALQIDRAGIKIAFIALHGRFGEDGTIQGLLDNMRIPYTGSGSEASRLALNKIMARKMFIRSGLNIPKADIVTSEFSDKLNVDKFPVVVKPATSGSSIGLSIVEKKENLALALSEAFEHDSEVLVEEYIKGRELTVGILEDNPLCIIEVIPRNKFFDYQAKYTKGLTEYIVPAKLSSGAYSKIQEAALSAHHALGCRGSSRVDIIADDAFTPFVLEVNTIPGLTENSLLPKAAGAQGISFGQLCVKLLCLARDYREVIARADAKN